MKRQWRAGRAARAMIPIVGGLALGGCAALQRVFPPDPDPAAAPARTAPVIPADSTPVVREAAPKIPAMTGPRVRIIGTNDFHGALEPRPDNAGILRGGAAAMAGEIARAVGECPAPECAAVIVDGGDMFQGTPASNFMFGRPVVEIYRNIGYAAAALGNHEFDWGQDTLRSLMRSAPYRILGANVRDTAGRDVPWIPNDTIVERGAYRIGIIGVATRQTPTSTRAAFVDDLRFVDPAPIVDSIVPVLRQRGAQVVVVIAHAGGTCNAAGECQGEILDFASRLRVRVDAIVAGHTHARLNTTIAGIPVVMARSRGQAIDVVDIPIGNDGRRTVAEIREVFTDSVTPSPIIRFIADEAVARVASRVNQPVAQVAQPLPKEGRQHALGNLIADAMRVVGRGDVAVMNDGGIRTGIQAGVATYGSLFEVQPFTNYLYRVRIRGRDLRTWFERALAGPTVFHVSGAHLYGSANPRRLDSLFVGGERVADAAVYTVVVNDFMLEGGDRLGFQGLPVTSEAAEVTDLDALMAYLRSLPQPVARAHDERITLRSN